MMDDETLPVGRGLSLRPQLPTLHVPKATIYADLINPPDRFKELSRLLHAARSLPPRLICTPTSTTKPL